MTRYSDLPVELLYQIADFLDFEAHINAFTRTNKRSYSALNSYLYRHHVERWDAVAFKSVCMSGFSNSARMFLDQGMSLDARDHDWNPIALAATYGHEDIVKYLLERGVDPNAKQAWELPPISYDEINYMCGGPFDLAVKNGHEGIARLLVPHMKSVDYFVRPTSRADVYDGRTPLTLAAENGHLNLIKMLVEDLNCDVEPTRTEEARKIAWNEMTPLARAAYGGHIDVVRYLLSAGADPNATFGAHWKTVLGYAVIGNHLETAKALIKYGSCPDPFIRLQQAETSFWHEANKDPYSCPCGRTQDRPLPCVLGPGRKYKYFDALAGIKYPLAYAGAHGNREMVNLLFQHTDLGRTREYGVHDANFLVPIAAACGLGNIVQRLLEEGCDMNEEFYLRMPHRPSVVRGDGLFHSSKFGHTGVVQVLLRHGANPDKERDHRDNPLLGAARAGHHQVVELLLDAGADPNTTYPVHHGKSHPVIMLAVQSEPMLRMLLNRGAASTLGPGMRSHLLGEVIKSRDVSILKTLLDSQFDLSFTENCHHFKYVMKMATIGGTAMFEYVVQYLRHRYGLIPGPQSSDSQRALHFAISCQQIEVVEIFLLRYGLQLQSKNMADCLAWAASGNDPTMAENMLDLLLRHGVDINARRTDGHTCLSLLACLKNVQGAKLVIERGAKYLWPHASYAKHPLSFAARTACVELLEFLLGLIDAEGISLEDIETDLEEAQDDLRNNNDEHLRLRLLRRLQDIRWRRRYPVL